MKRVCFPATSRVHLARQSLLLEELGKRMEVGVFEPANRGGGMSVDAIMVAVEFNNFLAKNNFDAVLIRGDRYEVLPMAAVGVYRSLKVYHIEGGDLSGAVDNKIRHAVTDLSDYHFCTNDEAHARLIQMGVHPERVWNYGSLDVEYAMSVPQTETDNGYILVAYHPIEKEDENELTKALEGYETITVGSNKDYGRSYGSEEFAPEEYINLMRSADCLVGNSSSFLKEASTTGVPVVLVGDRQHKRLIPKNVLQVPCESATIKDAIELQMKRVFEPDFTYYKPDTSVKIARKIEETI